MNRGREERRGKETDRCSLTTTSMRSSGDICHESDIPPFYFLLFYKPVMTLALMDTNLQNKSLLF
jgi:hypothetical protein